MPMNEALIAEMQREGTTTRRVLERVPSDKLEWAPHPKSMTLGALAMHVARIPALISNMIAEPVRDMSRGGPPAPAPDANLLETLDAALAEASTRLEGWTDAHLAADWTLERDGKTIFNAPRIRAARTLLLNHWIHHRGQLTVYLRLLDVPVPSVYGPSADENPFA